MKLSRSRVPGTLGVLVSALLAGSALVVPTGTASATIPLATLDHAAATAPSAPKITGVRARSGGALVFWDAPAPNGSPVTSYHIYPGLASLTVTTSGTATQGELTGLGNSDTSVYSIAVTATNAFGTSPAVPTATVGPRMSAAKIIAPGDFTGDGHSDLIGATGSVSRTSLTRASYLYRGNGRGGFAGSAGLNHPFSETDRFIFSAGDFDGQGFPDLLLVDNNGALTSQPGNGRGGFLLGTKRVPVGLGWRNMRLVFGPGDFTGDGKVDVMATNWARDGDLYLYRGNGHGGLAPGQRIGNGWIQFLTVFPAGDFTGDGKNDIMAINKFGGGLYLFRGNGRGGFTGASQKIGHGWSDFLSVFSPGDFNGDHLTDVMAVSRGGALLLFRGNGRGGFVGGAQKVGAGWNAFR